MTLEQCAGLRGAGRRPAALGDEVDEATEVEGHNAEGDLGAYFRKALSRKCALPILRLMVPNGGSATQPRRPHHAVIGLVLHCQFAGRPTGIPVMRKCIEYAKQHEGVWFARKGDIARWTLEREKASSKAA